MPRIISFALLLVAAALLPSAAGAAPAVERGAFMPVSEVRPGMLALGKTVFSGTKIEDFHLKILGVLPKANDGGDVILARVIDGPLIERQSSILEGMSGSPVYIRGRLIGAIAFGWQFSKEPIAGITPIADMLRALPAPPRPAATPRVSALSRPVVIGGRTIKEVRILNGAAAGRERGEPASVMTLRPMGGVLFASGLSGRAMDRLRETVRPFGAEVMQGVGGGSRFAGGDVRPGAMIGIELVRGDFDAGFLGTVTYVKGDKVLAFGHPMMSMGEVDLTMTTAYVTDFLSSYITSMKLGTTGRPIGRLTEDRMFAVAGIMGSKAKTVPMRINVTDRERGINRTYNVELAAHRDLTPGLAASIAMSAIDRAWERQSEGTAKVSVVVEGDQRTVRRSDTMYSPYDACLAALSDVAGPVALLMDNEFGGGGIKSVQVAVQLSSKRDAARIEDIALPPGKIRAGDTIDLRVTLRPFQKAPVDRHLQIQLPPDLPGGVLRIGVAGGAEAEQLRGMMGLGRRHAYNIEQLVDIYESQDRGTDLVAYVALPTNGVSLQGRQAPALPSHLLAVWDDAQSTAVERQTDCVKQVATCEWVISGREMVTVEVEGKPGAARRPAQPPRAQPAPKPPAPPSAGEAADEEDDDEDFLPYSGRVLSATGAGLTAAPLAATAGDNGQDKAEATPPAKQEKKDDKPIGRAPSVWTLAALPDLLPGEFDEVACADDGALSLGLKQTKVATFAEPLVTALLAQEGVIYAATAPGGQVRKLGAEGAVMQTWDTGAVMITSLVAGPQGTILAGAAPGGRVLSLTPDGKLQEYFATGEDTVWSLLTTPAGVYAATGPHGKVFLITAAGQGAVVARVPATNVYALARLGDTLYAGTGYAGGLYAISSTGAVRSAYDANTEAISCLAAGADGALYVGTAPQGTVVRLRPDGDAEQIAATPGDAVAALVARPDGALYALTARGGVLYRIDPKTESTQAVRKPKQGEALALALDEHGALVIGDCNPSAVTRLGPDFAAAGAFISKPRPAPAGTRWGALMCAIEQAQGVKASFQTRSGDSPDPDDHWSAWSAPVALDQVVNITSPPATYLQYRIALSTTQPTVTPRVRNVQISYLPPNREPSLSVTAPKAGDRLRASVDIRWKGQDPDRDKLVYDIATSADGGATWKSVKSDVDAVKYAWDTKPLKDGVYALRVTASDRRSNPGAARQQEDTRLVWVDNTAPAIFTLRHTMAVTDQGVVTIAGSATDALSPIQGVDYRIDEGTWSAAEIKDGCGELRSSFVIETTPVKPGEHHLYVRAFDAAGNSAEDEVRIAVKRPGEAAKEKPTAGATATEPSAPSPAKTD